MAGPELTAGSPDIPRGEPSRRAPTDRRDEWRLVTSAAVSGFGNWLTFLGIVQYAGQQFGMASIPGALAIQTIPGLLLGKMLAGRVPEGGTKRVFVRAQWGLALCSLLLAIWHQTLVQLYVYLLVTSCLKIYSGPLLNGLVGSARRVGDRQALFTRVSAAGAVSLSVAPALGGVIFQGFGPRPLFVVDALTFLITALLMRQVAGGDQGETRPARAVRTPGFSRGVVTAAVRALSPPEAMTGALRLALVRWASLGVLGAALTAIEFQVMKTRGYSPTGVGLVLAAWGAGNLAVLVAPRLLPTRLAVVGLSLGIVVWCASPAWLGIPLFAITGVAYAVVSGTVRHSLQNALEPARQNEVWGFATQVVLAISFTVYILVSSAQTIGVPDNALVAALGVVALGHVILDRWLTGRPTHGSTARVRRGAPPLPAAGGTQHVDDEERS